MYHDLLKKIADEMKQLGRAMQPICAFSELETLRKKSLQKLGMAVPEPYTAFLALTDGLDWNGLVVYASKRTAIVGFPDRYIEGYIEGNQDYRDFPPLKDYLIFAEDGVVLFTYRISASEYQVVTVVGLTLLESFRSFDELLANALQGHL